MSLLSIVGEVAGIGFGVLVPLAFVLYGYRGLSAASRAAGLFKLVLAVALGVAFESGRRAVGVSYGELFSMGIDLVMAGIDHLTGLL